MSDKKRAVGLAQHMLAQSRRFILVHLGCSHILTSADMITLSHSVAESEVRGCKMYIWGLSCGGCNLKSMVYIQILILRMPGH